VPRIRRLTTRTVRASREIVQSSHEGRARALDTVSESGEAAAPAKDARRTTNGAVMATKCRVRGVKRMNAESNAAPAPRNDAMRPSRRLRPSAPSRRTQEHRSDVEPPEPPAGRPLTAVTSRDSVTQATSSPRQMAWARARFLFPSSTSRTSAGVSRRNRSHAPSGFLAFRTPRLSFEEVEPG
jgi:hypothetical protein